MAAAILAGWLCDRLLGDPTRLHPVAGFGRIAGALERRCWRPSRAAGAIHVAVLVGAIAAAAAAIDRALPGRPRTAFRVMVVWATLGGRSLAPTLAGRDPTRLEAGELCRVAVESVAENASDAVVAPLLWAALLGVPGVAAYRAVNTLDAMVGHRGERYQRFGWAPARLDDLANWPAARATSLLAIAWAPAVGGRRDEAWRAAFRDGAAHPSPNAGRVEGAFAGALSLRLGGLNRYPHGLERRPTLGSGRPPAVADIARSVRLAKLWSLAGIRAGYLLARPEVVERLAAHRQPWSVNTLACAALATCAGDRRTARRLAAEVAAARNELVNALSGFPGVRVWRSVANFFLLRVPDGPGLVAALRERGIAVRPASTFPGLGENHIRIAVRTRPENAALLDALEELLD